MQLTGDRRDGQTVFTSRDLAKKIAKLNDDSCADESQDIECVERDSFQEANEKKEGLREVKTAVM